MQSAIQYVVATLKERPGEIISFSELEQLLTPKSKMLGFGVEPHHVVQSMLQLGRVSYDEITGIIRLQDNSREAILQRGQEYLQLLEKDPERAEGLKTSTPSLEKDYLDSIRTIHRIHGYDKATQLFK